MKEKNSLVELTLMKYLLPIYGIILPGLENHVRFPQWIMPFFRNLAYLTLFNIFSYGQLMLASLFFGKDNSFEISVFYFVSAFNVFCCIVRILFSWIYSKEIQAVAKQLNSNFSNPMQSSFRKLNVKQKIGVVNTIGYVSFSLQEMTSIVSQFYHAIVNHKNCHPSMLTLDASNLPLFIPYIMFNLITAFLYVGGSASYEWMLLAFLRLTTVEMEVLRQQLNAIFSSLRYDENCEPLIRKNLHKSTLNEMVGTTFAKSEYQTVKEDPAYYKEKIKLLDNALNEFIIHHVQTIKMLRTLRKIYGVIIVMTYGNNVVLSTTWILFSSSSSAPGAEVNTSFMSTFAIIALTTLYMDSYFGEECVSSGLQIVDDVYAMDWHLYPVGMQKKLLMILMISQRPLFIDAHSIGPLCKASFSAVIQFCYSLFTFFNA